MKIVFPIAAALVVVAIATYVQGIWSERWGKLRSERLAEFTKRLSEVPLTIGDWDGTDQEVDKAQLARSNCDGHVSREYMNRRNKEVVSVYLVSGTGRHVTIHTPDWCYRGAGYEMDDAAIAYTMRVEGLGAQPEFRTATFTKTDETGRTDRLRIFWSFTDDGTWLGPSSPKPKYGTRDALYKVYFITKAALRQETPEDSPALDFARQFFPLVNEILFPTNGAKQEVAASSAAKRHDT
jgi:hypothetical protein